VGTTEAIEKGIWLTRVTLEDYDVRGALILGQARAVVWDTLSRPRDMRPFLPLIGNREIVVVYSHADWDHVWGTAGLDYDGVPIVAHEHCGRRFAADVPVVLAEKRTAGPGAWDDVVLVPPTECFEHERLLDLGGITLALRHLPGHTPDCIVGFIPERGILFAGDTVETPCPVVPADSSLAAWISELRVWAEDARVRRVIPAHGAIGGREILQQNVEYLEGIRTGRPTAPTGQLSRFYRDTHLKNVQWRGTSAEEA
jgi:glyoxylase-like metal-dependent hydrolase (beta-lactamase superfamily II)